MRSRAEHCKRDQRVAFGPPLLTSKRDATGRNDNRPRAIFRQARNASATRRTSRRRDVSISQRGWIADAQPPAGDGAASVVGSAARRLPRFRRQIARRRSVGGRWQFGFIAAQTEHPAGVAASAALEAERPGIGHHGDATPLPQAWTRSLRTLRRRPPSAPGRDAHRPSSVSVRASGRLRIRVRRRARIFGEWMAMRALRHWTHAKRRRLRLHPGLAVRLWARCCGRRPGCASA